MNETNPVRRSPAKRLGVAVAVLVIAAAMGLAATMAVIHGRTTRSDVTAFSDPVPADVPYYVDVLVKIVAVDLDKETVGIQLECVPRGKSLVDSDGHLTSRLVITLGVSASGIQQKKLIPAGDKGGLTTVSLDLDGNVEDYPWDRHRTTLWLQVFREGKGRDPEPLYVRLEGRGAWPGLQVDLGTVGSSNWTYGGEDPWQLKVSLTRSQVTTVVVYFSMVLTWVLIASVVSMTLAVAVGGRKTEIAMVAFFTTLLFAMTAFRNALPGAPPMGAYSDYLAFFWGYAVAIVAVGVLSVVWMRRREPKGEHPPK